MRLQEWYRRMRRHILTTGRQTIYNSITGAATLPHKFNFMGLDMYLNKRTYIGAKYEHRKITGVIDIKEDGKPIPVNFSRVTYIEEEIGYWRKANAIHKWIVDNCADGRDECQDIYMEPAKMQQLLDLCREVKRRAVLVEGAVTNGYTFTKDGQKMPIVAKGKEIQNAEEIAELLPTESGFFFGSTDYDQYYMNDIDDTIEILEGALKEEGGDIYYQASW